VYIFTAWRLPTIWEETAAKDHLKITLEKPVEINPGKTTPILVQQFMLGLENSTFPGPELSRSDTGVVAYTKCSGIDVMKFVCAPDIKPVMPELYNGLCPALVSHPPK